ncbi:MAG: hypothetical protein LWY06_12125 [Firmicutes bacterium]|nr:hypothetical protein [Bacillota bacterium]
MKLNKLAYSFAILCQFVILTFEYLATVMILMVDPVRLGNFLASSKLNLTLLNKATLAVLGIFGSTQMKTVGFGILTAAFIAIIYYFVIAKAVWLKPSEHINKLMIITTISTIIFCLFAINFWQIYSNFM